MKKILLTTILIILSVLCFGQDPQSIAMSNYFFISSGNWNDGSHWNTGEVPPEGCDVFIAADAVIPAGYTAIANQISLLGGSITVADGGQLKHNTPGLVVTMEKSIAAFNELNSWSNYYLLAFPFSEDVAVPSMMTANEDNDFYTFDSNYPNAEWRNNKQHVIATVGGTTGYLYANPEAIELSLTGSTYQSYDEASITVEVTYSEGLNNTFNGWALLGNPYTCNAYIYALENGSCVPKEFMVYDADGELVRCFCSSVAPMQGFFVKVDETTTICIKTTSPYVDLGLPSGTLWAACNVGAVTPEDYGDYFAWGETQPKDFYDWSTYQHCNGSNNTLTKYCSDASFGYNGFSDTLTVLLPEDDAATANWGNDWRMPTKEEWQELYNNTTHVWTTQNGVNGRLFTSENGNSLFLPAGGIYSNGSLGSTGSGSYYWSSSLSIESPNLSWQCSFYSNGCNSYEFARFFGLSVRPVSSGIQSTSYLIDATANPTEGGEVSGSGSFIEGTECTLTATANEGYTFTNWTENDEVVSTEAVYIFTVDSDRTLVANFTYNGGGNDHEYVDLGLPSGTLWATCNVGANSPEDYGNHFAWGETQPKNNYYWNTYQYCNGGDGWNTLTKYCSNFSYGYNGFTDNLTYLQSSDDVATVNWGEDWRMPTKEEWQELHNNTICTWVTQNSVNGRLFTASNGNSIFIPAAGYGDLNGPNATGNMGDYWSRTLNPSFPYYAYGFYFDSGGFSVYDSDRCGGLCVRPVRSQPQGAIIGLFSVSDTRKVYFSQGNLQYQASSNTWRFAENQWDYVGTHTPENNEPIGGTVVGSDNHNISSTYSGWIDLFGWGTSSYHDSNDPYNVNYQPWSTSWSTVNEYYNYYGYGPSTNMSSPNLTGSSANYDWGIYNPITNGGNTSNQWRTLTQSEWSYVFFDRATISGIRYAKAKVNNVNGIILLPDNWSNSIYSLSDTNTEDASFNSNILTISEWNIIEDAGAVFLPAAGARSETWIYSVGSVGFYWSTSYYNSESGCDVIFGDNFINNSYSGRIGGLSVRLVSTFENIITKTITVTSNPMEGGSVSGGGTYQQGQSCMVSATATAGYTFTNWTENGSVVSTNANYTFTVNSNRTLVANFSAQVPNIYTISVSSNPTNGGSVTGGGTYQQGQSCTVTAIAASGYTFLRWTENGNQVSTNANYTFSVTSNRSLMASFTQNGSAPPGSINGLFSVSDNQQVYFSRGNLQYQASTNTWRFATNQYDYVGSANSSISSTNSGWIDLFGWGTSGYNHGAVCYQPWSTSTNFRDYYAYGNYQYNLCDQTGQADWGYNPISNGGNATDQWRTLTQPEWDYVFNTRVTTSGIRYAMANVNNVNGVILLPDDWNTSIYSLSTTNSSEASFSSNTLTASQWNTLEQAGAVFLPAAGFRGGTSVIFVGSYGCYWSASFYYSNGAYNMYFGDSYLYTGDYYRYRGRSVRLVSTLENVITKTVMVTSNPIEGGSVSGGGTYQQGQSCTVSATATAGYTFTNWTENGSVVSTNANYTFSVTSNRTLVANFTEVQASPTGAITGLFTINATGGQVYFSQGNLQYQASTDTWRFATNQWNFVGGTDSQFGTYGNVSGSTNNNISPNYNGWIDLFGWGTSGYSNKPPYMTSTDYLDYGSWSFDIAGTDYDWGVYNAIINGGNQAGQWRTLTYDEWRYVLKTRSASIVNGTANARYAKAMVGGVRGVILFPDDYTHPSGVLPPEEINDTGNIAGNGDWTWNHYNINDFALMQAEGAVFLPAAGYRVGTTFHAIWYDGGFDLSECGFYWSASALWNIGSTNLNAWNVGIDSDGIEVTGKPRHYGLSVRLVQDHER